MARNEQFSLDTIHLLDLGKINEAFKAEIMHVVKDCIDRPLDDKERTVSIVFRVTPNVDTKAGERDCDRVAVACDIKSTIPTRKTRIYDMKVHQNGMLSFHPDLPEEPEGGTLYDDQNKKKDDQNRPQADRPPENRPPQIP
jgi:hypothetical protein